MLLLTISSNDSGGIKFSIIMILIGVLLIVISFLISRKRSKERKEYDRLKVEMNSIKNKITETKKQIEDIQPIVQSMQGQISEYN